MVSRYFLGGALDIRLDWEAFLAVVCSSAFWCAKRSKTSEGIDCEAFLAGILISAPLVLGMKAGTGYV
jgi:hypothetical protein